MSFGIYIHIPFCARKCLYCDFTSTAGSEVPEEEYAIAVIREMEARREEISAEREISTIYIGGGTPSLFSPKTIGVILSHITNLANLSQDIEITIEINPGTTNIERLKGYRASGINRLSIGVQSFNDVSLSALGRIHSREEALKAFDDGRMAGFKNISIDLIHSLPGQTLSDWEKDLQEVVRLGPQHISTYNLIVEEGTPFFKIKHDGRLYLPTEEEQEKMMLLTTDYLTSSGYEHYEVSNYALPGHRSRHNQIYWRGGEYIGLGVAAHSFMQKGGKGYGKRSANTDSLSEYLRLTRDGKRTVIEEEVLTRDQGMGEFIFLGLRMMEGVDPLELERRFGIAVKDRFPGAVEGLIKKGLLEDHKGRLRVTRKGLLFLNDVSLPFIS